MEEKILNILTDLCDDDIVKTKKDINLFEVGLLDSLAVAELLFAIEEEFNIIISPSEIKREDMDTPNKIINIIKERI